jgi:hypothetical protein
MNYSKNNKRIQNGACKPILLPMPRRTVVAPVYCRWIAIFILLAGLSVPAQEALQNSLTGESVSAARDKQMQSQDYTFKNGDFRLLVLPSLGVEWNDNVNLSDTNKLDDYIVTPAVGMTASYPFTQRNLLFVDISVGYDRYLLHPSLSTFVLNSASRTGVSFDIGIKDVTVNLHDWISYVQDSAQNAAVANTASYGTFQNTAGLAGTWDLNQVTLSAGYDHQNILATSAQFDNVNHSAEMLFARAGFQVHPKIAVGLESTAAFTAYSQSGTNGLNNNDAYTAGVYTELRPSQFLTITARGGYATYQFQQTSTSIQTSSQNSWYASLHVAHEPRDSVNYSLEAGHEVQLGTTSDLVEDWYVRPNINWRIIKGFDFNTSFFYEHGNQGVGSSGSLPGYSNGTFDWYGSQLSIQHQLTSRFALSLNYRITLRSSSTPDDGYTQNLVGLQLTYHPK